MLTSLESLARTIGVVTNDRKRSPYPVEKETIIMKMGSERGVPKRDGAELLHILQVGLRLELP